MWRREDGGRCGQGAVGVGEWKRATRMVWMVGAVGCVEVLQLQPVVVSIWPVSKTWKKAARVPEDFIILMPLETFPSAQKAPVVEHVCGIRVQGPVVALPGVSGLPWDFHKAVVQGKVVADGVLPRGEFFPVVGESVADELADLAESQALLGALQDGHGDQGDVGVGRLHEGTFPGFVPGHGSCLRAGAQLLGIPEPGRLSPVGRVLGEVVVRVGFQAELPVDELSVLPDGDVPADHIDVHIFGQSRAVGHIRPQSHPW